MLTKLTNWWKNFVHEMKKTDVERFLEHSTDIYDLENRIQAYNRRQGNWADNRNY